MDILASRSQELEPATRKVLVQSLILLRNQGMVENTILLPLFFKLFQCHDKVLRELLYTHIISDIKRSNASSKNNKLNKSLQGFMFTLLTSAEGAAASGS